MNTTHELTIYKSGTVDGNRFPVRQGECRAHTLRLTFPEGLNGAAVRLRLKAPGMQARTYDTAEGGGTISGSAATFTPWAWETAGNVAVDIEVNKDNGLEIWKSQRFCIRVYPALEEFGAETPTGDATATEADLLAGKTAYAKGVKLTGTHVPLDTSDATATAADIVAGKTAYVNGKKITGKLTSLIPGDTSVDFGIDGKLMQGYNPGEYGGIPTPEYKQKENRVQAAWGGYIEEKGAVHADGTKTVADVARDFIQWNEANGYYLSADNAMKTTNGVTYLAKLGNLNEGDAGTYSRWVYFIENEENYEVFPLVTSYVEYLLQSFDYVLQPRQIIRLAYMWDYRQIPW